MVGGNIGFSISDMSAPDDQAALVGRRKRDKSRAWQFGKQRPPGGRSVIGGNALSWQGNTFSSSRAASGFALMILFVETGDLVSGQIISTSALALAVGARWRFRQPPPSIEAARLLPVSTEAPEQSFPLRLQREFDPMQ